MRTLTGWRCLPAIGVFTILSSPLVPATMSLASEAEILGRITGPDGAVVADAMVLLTPVNTVSRAEPVPARTLRSDQAGTFYAVVPAGRYRVAVVKSGFDVAMTDMNSRASSVLRLEMTRSGDSRRGRGSPVAKEDDLGSDWILRQRRDNVLRAVQPEIADGVVQTEAVRANASAVGREGWASTLLAPLDGHFVQQFSGGASINQDGEAALGLTTGLSLEGALVEDTRWRFDGWSERTRDQVDDAGGRLEDRNNRAAIGFDYRPDGRDAVTSELSYGARRYTVETPVPASAGTEQMQRSIALRSRWEHPVNEDADLYVEGRYLETGAGRPDGMADEGWIENRYWSAASGVMLRAGDHSIELGLAAEQYDYRLWDEGVVLYGHDVVPGPGIETGAGPAFSLLAADRWQTGALTELSYGLRYHAQTRSGASYMVPAVGMTFTPPGQSGVVLHSEVLYRFDGERAAGAPVGEARPGGEGERLGYVVGIERRPRSSDDRLHLAASYSFRPFADGRQSGADSGLGGSPRSAPLVLGDGSTSRHEVEVEMAHAFGMFRGGLAGKVGLAEGRLSPAMNEAPVQRLAEGEARYYQTQIWAACVQTDTEVQVDYQRVLAAERLAAPGVEPADYRRLDFVVYQQIPGPRALGEARLRVLMAYQGFDYDSLYDNPDGAAVSGRASRLTGGLDISF